ncbi:MAG: hypothetical protein KTR31_29115 [Myxococcales bacterium]|nr:hypothetical protein [Myxococcales bacterium]
MRTRPALLGLLCLGCVVDQGPRPGTSVGNPGKKMVRTAPSEGVEVVEAVAESLTVDWIGCGGGYERGVVDQEVDLVNRDELAVPPGEWCGLALSFAAPIVVVGEATDIGEASVEGRLQPAAVVTLWAAAPIVVDEHAFVLELGAPDWLHPDELELEEGVERLFEEDDFLGLRTASAVAGFSALFADAHGTGEIDAYERAVGPLASPQLPPPPALAVSDEELPRVSSEECGCKTGPTSLAVGPWLVVAAVGLRRRRARQ